MVQPEELVQTQEGAFGVGGFHDCTMADASAKSPVRLYDPVSFSAFKNSLIMIIM